MIINQIGSGGGSPEYVTYSGTLSRSDDSTGSDFAVDIDVGAELGDDFSLVLMTHGAPDVGMCIVALLQKPFGKWIITPQDRIYADVYESYTSFGTSDVKVNGHTVENWTVTKNGNIITVSGSTLPYMTWNDVYQFTGKYIWYVTTTV